MPSLLQNSRSCESQQNRFIALELPNITHTTLSRFIHIDTFGDTSTCMSTPITQTYAYTLYQHPHLLYFALGLAMRWQIWLHALHVLPKAILAFLGLSITRSALHSCDIPSGSLLYFPACYLLVFHVYSQYLYCLVEISFPISSRVYFYYKYSGLA